MFARNLLNLLLLAVAAGLVLVVIYRPGVEPESTPQAITGIDAGQVDTIHIERQGREPLEFIHRTDGWTLVHDPELPAAEFQVRALLRILQAKTGRSYPAGSLDLGKLGLEPPQATVTMDSVKLLIGVTEALDNKRYVLTGGRVALINDQYQHLVNADWPNFVSRKLLAGSKPVTRLELPGLSLASTDGKWRLEPEDEAAGADALQRLVDAWQNATALYTRRYAGAKSQETISLYMQDKTTPLRFLLVSRAPDLILARPDWGIQYHLNGTLEDSLFRLQKQEQEKEAAADSSK